MNPAFVKASIDGTAIIVILSILRVIFPTISSLLSFFRHRCPLCSTETTNEKLVKNHHLDSLLQKLMTEKEVALKRYVDAMTLEPGSLVGWGWGMLFQRLLGIFLHASIRFALANIFILILFRKFKRRCQSSCSEGFVSRRSCLSKTFAPHTARIRILFPGIFQHCILSLQLINQHHHPTFVSTSLPIHSPPSEST